MPQPYDFVIVGQGLAGSLLAMSLLQRGQRLMVVDDNHRSSASMVAAGLLNPLAGMRFNRPPRIDEWLDAATGVYSEWGRLIGSPIWQECTMLRLFRSTEQIHFYERQAGDAAAAGLLGDRFAPEQSGEPVHARYGGFRQRRTGYVDVGRLLPAIREQLVARHCYHQVPFDYNDIGIDADAIRWRDVQARQIIFCEGFRLKHNPWFEWLNLQPDKGEILTLQSAPDMPRQIVNGAHWLLPQSDGGYRFGTTHDHSDLVPEPTGAGRAELLAGLAEMLTVEAPPVVDHRAGIRPATSDRRPLLGRHPDLPRLAVFNGFGGRGCLTIPWYAERFADHLLGRGPLPVEADIGRHAR